MYNDKQDLSTDEDETFPEVIEEMYNDNNENYNNSNSNNNNNNICRI